MQKFLTLCLFSFVALTFGNAVNAETRFLRSAENLDDPSGYCLDIPGFGPRMQKDAPINTHTCKYNRPGFSVDELFEVTETKHLRMPEYDLCLSAGEFKAGSRVYTIDCSLPKVHAWQVSDSGRVTPSEHSELCLTLSSQKNYVNTSTANLTANSSRSVSLEKCDPKQATYQSWKWSEHDELNTETANTLRGGMPTAIAAGIRELGYEVKPQETFALYADEPRMFTKQDVSISEPTAYASGKNQLLQVYHGKNRNHPRDTAPIIVLVHGGGFARGGLNGLASVATHFAGLGFVAVNMTYPLTPEATWPDGATSVASAVNWVKANAKEIKGNPDQIFVLGTSAGGRHVADFAFRPSIVEGESPIVAGVILASPALSLDAKSPSPNTLAYFGKNTSQYADMQALDHLERTSIPVLTLVSEFDPTSFHENAATLFAKLVTEKEVKTRFRALPGHNHVSHVTSIGTADTLVTEEILDFMLTRSQN